MEVLNYKGTPMLGGYAPVPNVNWAVVAQQPRELSLATLGQLERDMVVGMIPVGCFCILLILVGTRLIAYPLRQLSAAADQFAAAESTEQLQRVHAWYRDASDIRQAMLSDRHLFQQKLGQLIQEAQSDPLSSLANRRAMGTVWDLLEQTGQQYSLLALDIDHFKRVNDTFGHEAGDNVLRMIAEIIRQNPRTDDFACRTGGEEFVLILPDTSLDSTLVIAERIRESIAETEFPKIGKLTMSIGVACSGAEVVTPEAVLKLADERLYSAKQNGRNRVIV
ncbi:diguanylate cyclase [Pseudomonas fluorescens]